MGRLSHAGKLVPDLSATIRKYKPSTVYFLGDSDTAFIFEFSHEAAKLVFEILAPT
jgi:hypothetical protein